MIAMPWSAQMKIFITDAAQTDQRMKPDAILSESCVGTGSKSGFSASILFHEIRNICGKKL
jgi:hypothetical protein